MNTGEFPVDVTVTVLVTDWPTLTVPKLTPAGTLRLLTGATPVPFSVTTAGPSSESFGIVSVAVSAPALVGLKTMFTPHELCGGTVGGFWFEHVSEFTSIVKSLAFDPVIVGGPAMCDGSLPLFENVSVIDFCKPFSTLPYCTGFGDTVKWLSRPVPLRPTLAVGWFGSSLEICSVAFREPLALGVNVTFRLQFEPGWSVSGRLPQSPALTAKSPALPPVIVAALTCSGASPLSTMFTCCACVVLPSPMLGSESDGGLTWICGCWPNPCRVTDCGEFDALSWMFKL